MTRSDEIKKEGQMKIGGRERPTPLVLLHSGCFLKSAHSPAGAKREREGEIGRGWGRGVGWRWVEQVEVWGERKVNQSWR